MQKAVSRLIPAFLFAAASSAHGYYLEHAIPGKATVTVNGACAVPATTFNAYLADIKDDAQQPIGRGLVTSTGQILALEETRSEISYQHDYASGEKVARHYVDVVGDRLRAFLASHGQVCTIDTLEPDYRSRASYAWDASGGSVSWRAGFGGNEQQRCYSEMNRERCVAGTIRGSIRFHGSWQSAN